MRFTVHRPPDGEVSLRWHRPSGGDVTCRVHVGVALPRSAGHTREDRLALAVFGRDMPTSGASLRRVRSRDPFQVPRSLALKPGKQPAPPLTTDRAVEAPFLRNPNTRLVQSSARRASHRPHVEVFHPNGVEPARQIGSNLFHPVASAVCFAGFDPNDRQFGAPSAAGVALGARLALLQAAQADPFSRCQARGVQQLAGGQCRRHRHPAVDADHAAIARQLISGSASLPFMKAGVSR